MEDRTAFCHGTNTRHMHTEKRRRDRIASGFEGLRELVPCKDRKMDKATFLQEVVEYVTQLQAAVQQAVTLGSLSTLPEESQWQVRLLLPRQQTGHLPQKSRTSPEGEAQLSAAAIDVEEGPANTVVEFAQRSRDLGAEGLPPETFPPIPQERESAELRGLLQTPGSSMRTSGEGQTRLRQLQTMLRQLQSQQALSAQQLQMQQAALMQSQLYNVYQLHQLTHAPHQDAKAGHAQQPSKHLGSTQAEAEALTPEGATSRPCTAAFQEPQGGPEICRNAQLLSRKSQKIRRHTTAAKSVNPHSNPSSNSSSASDEGLQGRPGKSALQ